jgi:hypothetical protein
MKIHILMPVLFSCSSGSVILQKEVDTSEPIPEEEEIMERTWTGHREIAFEGQCEFSIYEEGERILDENIEAYQLVMTDCLDCQVFKLLTTPEYTDCGELGTLGTGGIRYRSVRYTEEGLDIWYIYEPTPPHSPNWLIEFIVTAQGNDTAWGYEVLDNFQAFEYTTTGQISLAP